MNLPLKGQCDICGAVNVDVWMEIRSGIDTYICDKCDYEREKECVRYSRKGTEK